MEKRQCQRMIVYMGAHLPVLRRICSDALILENILKETQADRVSCIFPTADERHGSRLRSLRWATESERFCHLAMQRVEIEVGLIYD